MSITFQYGPVGSAISLAQQAGKGQYRRQTAQDDNQFLSQVNAAQRTADDAYSNEIQSALAGRQLDQRAAQSNVDNQYRQNAFDANAAEQSNDRASRERIATLNQAAISGRQQSNQGFRDERDAGERGYLQSLPESALKTQSLAYFDATGKLPASALPQSPRSASADNSGRDLRSEYSRLVSELARTEKELKTSAYDDSKSFDNTADGINRSASVPGAISGREARYQAADRTRLAILERLQKLNGALAGRTDSLLGSSQPAVSSQAAQEIIQSRQQPVPQSAGQQSGNPPVVDSAQEYAQLPSGATYIDAQDGQTYVKK